MKVDIAHHHIDRLLFRLRWFLIAGVLVWSLWGPPPAGDTAPNISMLVLAAGITVYNLVLFGVRWALADDWGMQFAITTLLLDALIGVLIFIASGGVALALVAGGIFPILVAWLRFGTRGGLPITLATCVVDLLYLVVDRGAAEQASAFLYVAAMLALLIMGTSAGQIYRQMRRTGPPLSEVEQDALALRAARARARITFEMAAVLSADLNLATVLSAALEMAEKGMRDIGETATLVGCALLFDGDEMYVAAERGLTRTDAKVRIPGRRGAIGLCLRQTEPIFSNNPNEDPELRQFMALKTCRSLLCVPLRAGYDDFGALVMGTEQTDMFEDEQVALFSAIGTQATIALQNTTLYNNLIEERDRIVEVDKEARKQLARDLHDGPTQSVSAIAMRVNYIRRLIERQPEDVPEELYKVEELARQTVKEIRNFLFTLRPLALESQGLSGALEQLAEKMKDTYKQNVIVQVQERTEAMLSEHAQGTLFYIADEAINNARKHAKAAHIWVRLYIRHDAVIFEVQDDGEGFDIEEVQESYLDRESQSLGMVNMRERAALIDGVLDMQSAVGQGTMIQVLIPRDSRHVIERPHRT